ncbi:MAG: dethiobiotin synthase [Alphaproteobacteria bacterium]|nr:dethiobiotin synthase [Alphaproteobacteria bacterium]
MSRFIVTGTDTGVGKTVVAATLVAGLGASYWKPIQAGFTDGTDRERVAELSGAPADKILPEVYCLSVPASPHFAAEQDGLEIDVARLQIPDGSDPLIVEGAGGLMVPITRSALQIDVFANWGLPIILVARTALGTINHSLLSIAALKARSIPIQGVVFVGKENSDSQNTICEMGKVRQLARLPFLSPLTPPAIAQAFADYFKREDFA